MFLFQLSLELQKQQSLMLSIKKLGIRRPPISRRQLHLMVPAKGGIRRKYGGSKLSKGFRKADLVRTEKYGMCLVCGEYNGQIAVANSDWKRLGYVSAKKSRNDSSLYWIDLRIGG